MSPRANDRLLSEADDRGQSMEASSNLKSHSESPLCEREQAAVKTQSEMSKQKGGAGTKIALS